MRSNARYYDPGLGRFVSADSIVPGAGPLTLAPHDAVAAKAWGERTQGGPGNPQELNRYTYVLNNPAKFSDPTGHIAWVVGAAVVGAAVNTVLYVGMSVAMRQEITAGGVLGAAAIGAVGGAVTAIAGPLAGSAVATRGGMAVAGLIGKGATKLGVEAATSTLGSFAAEATGSIVETAFSGSSDALDWAKTTTTTAADTTIVSPIATIDMGSGSDTMGELNHNMRTIVPRGRQAIPKDLANQRYAKSVLRFNSAISTIGGVALGYLYDRLTER